MTIDEEIKNGLKLLGLDTEEKRLKFKKITDISNKQEKPKYIFEFSTVQKLDWEMAGEEDIDA